MNIGALVRQERKKRGISAERIAQSLKQPICRQAFLQNERNSSFSAEVLKEIADIIGCSVSDFYRNSEVKMVERKERLQKAVDAIMPVVGTLTSSEWSRIVGIVDWYYSTKAAKTMLDGSDVQNMKETLYSELGLNQQSE